MSKTQFVHNRNIQSHLKLVEVRHLRMSVNFLWMICIISKSSTKISHQIFQILFRTIDQKIFFLLLWILWGCRVNVKAYIYININKRGVHEHLKIIQS